MLVLDHNYWSRMYSKGIQWKDRGIQCSISTAVWNSSTIGHSTAGIRSAKHGSWYLSNLFDPTAASFETQQRSRLLHRQVWSLLSLCQQRNWSWESSLFYRISLLCGTGHPHRHFGDLFVYEDSRSQILETLIPSLDFKAHHAIQDSFFSTIMYLFHHHTSMTCLIGIGVCHVWWIGGLLVLQSYLMLRNLTTNEMLTNRKLRFGPFQSIYSRGLLLNVLEMFHLSIGPWHALDIDWKTVLDFSDYSFAKNMDRPNEESQSFIL